MDAVELTSVDNVTSVPDGQGGMVLPDAVVEIMREASGTKRTTTTRTTEGSSVAHQNAQTEYREATQVGNTSARPGTM